MQSIKKQIHVFKTNLNDKYKLIPFNLKGNFVGKTKFFPASSKEWRNNVYCFNENYIKNLPVYDINLHKLLLSYMNMFFKNKFLFKKYITRKLRYRFLNKIYISKSEIKHTSSKAIITLYVYNREKQSLLNKKRIRNSIFLFLERMLKFQDLNNLFFFKPIVKYFSKIGKNNNELDKINNENFSSSYFKLLNISNIKNSIYKKSRYIYKLKKKLIFVRKYLFRLNINKYKFEEIFLNKLSKLIKGFYNKKVEINIINLQSIVLNPSIFTEILRLKLKKKRIYSIIKSMNFVLGQINLPKKNTIIERGRLIKDINFDLLENKYKTLNLNSIVTENNLDRILGELYDNKPSKKNFIFNNIKYKNIGGIRLEVKGRLTKRYRAERAVFKVKWKGGLKNIDASFKGLSAVTFRGYLNSNVEYSMSASKRRIGSFAVKGWISGK